MLSISIGLLLAHVALGAAVFALGGEHRWLLTLLLSWYFVVMSGFIAAIWFQFRRSARRVERSH